jgi:hypothetical protein
MFSLPPLAGRGLGVRAGVARQLSKKAGAGL